MMTPIILIASLLPFSVADAWALSPAAWASFVSQPWQKEKYDYDLVVIGAGASGLFAAGTASSVGFKTLLIERAHVDRDNDAPVVEFNVGGDCTNAACVPSKAVRSIARMSSASRAGGNMKQDAGDDSGKWLKLARLQADDAVGKVRGREDPSRIGDAPNLDLEFVRDCCFTSDHKMKIVSYDNTTWLEGKDISAADAILEEKTISGKKFIISTGASPTLPKALAKAATNVGVPYFTYRSLLRPNSLDTLLNATAKNVVIVGGGATACELGQSLSRLGGKDLNLSIVAPTILPSEDVTLQEAAMKILFDDNCNLHLGCRAVDIIENEGGPVLVTSDNSSIPVDCLIFCTGRSPASSLQSLHLDEAGIAWNADEGVMVNSYLRSKTARHVYASGDCASAVSRGDRRAIHAGWTGFNAARNALLPPFLRSPATHPFVPRVAYLDPEVAGAGPGVAECALRFGADGYDRLLVPEVGSDRADVESGERRAGANFVELRAERTSGRLLGASACGPAAAEIINEASLALVNRLTVRQIARTLHSYPSHGYLLYRVSMALAMQKISGLLAGCGLFGRFLGAQLRLIERVAETLKFKWLPWKKHAMSKLHHWQATGSSNALHLQTDDGKPSLISFLDAYNNKTLCTQILTGLNMDIDVRHGRRDFIEWVDAKG